MVGRKDGNSSPQHHRPDGLKEQAAGDSCADFDALDHSVPEKVDPVQEAVEFVPDLEVIQVNFGPPLIIAVQLEFQDHNGRWGKDRFAVQYGQPVKGAEIDCLAEPDQHLARRGEFGQANCSWKRRTSLHVDLFGK